MLASTTLRIDNHVLEEISKIASKLHLDRGTYLRQLIMQAYEEQILDLAVKDYQDGKITIGELTERTGRTIWDILEILKQRKIPSNARVEDIKKSSKLSSS